MTCAEALLDGLERRTVVIADKAYDADRVRGHIKGQGAIANIPNKSSRKRRYRWKKEVYRERNHVERFFNKLKQFRRIATRYDKEPPSWLLSSSLLCEFPSDQLSPRPSLRDSSAAYGRAASTGARDWRQES